MIQNKKIKVINWINGEETEEGISSWLDKFNPHSGELLCQVADSSEPQIQMAVSSAEESFKAWSKVTPVARGQVLFEIARLMSLNSEELARSIALETGKPPADAKGEVSAAILQAQFFAGEGMRLYGKSLTSAMLGKSSFTVRDPHGVVGLIVPANTPIANIAWKIFPALICGNSLVLKASEDAPSIAIILAKLVQQAGLPDGVLNIIQGSKNAGEALVNNNSISLISFTGSTNVGKWIAENAGRRLARVSLELGGKNAFVVCDDAYMDQAVHWACLSAFSNAGQRCAAASRIFIFEKIYEEFLTKFIAKAQTLKIGITEGCDLGPVINPRQYQNILSAIKMAKEAGGEMHCGGAIEHNKNLKNGFYILPTVISGLTESDSLNLEEIFGPVATVKKIKDLEEGQDPPQPQKVKGTSAIHTQNIDKALWFAKEVKSGIVNINIGTFGSEPHMPFGGFKNSGNGTREPGVEALDVYSELKNISLLVRDQLI